MAEPPVLAVDLDGTVVRTDMLAETLCAGFAANGLRAVGALTALFRGRAALKAAFARLTDIDPALLPYDPEVLDYVRRHRESGGRAVLATASDAAVANRIAAHLGLFDAVHASDGDRNLKGAAKARALSEVYGEGRFDYIGDSTADLPVWKAARRAIVAGPSDALFRKVRAAHGDAVRLARPPAGIAPYLRALRPHQWSKNALVFVPVLAAHTGMGSSWWAAFLAFVSLSLIASGTYIFNDMLDLAADRTHPRKRNRPFASGDVPLSHGVALGVLLLLGGVAVGVAIGRPLFLLALAAYVVTTVAYSLVLKRRIVIDICTLAVLYTLRLLAGGAATDTPLSVWILAFSMFLFFALAGVKRQAELVDMKISGRHSAEGRALTVDDLPAVTAMSVASGYVSVLVLALYLNSETVQQLYARPGALWGICIVLLYWISRVNLLTGRGRMHDDPIVFALRDRVSLLCGVLIAALFYAGAAT